MNAMIDDETLDRQLREAAPYIDDEGFTARVIARLPATRREPRWLRAMVLLGVTAIGSGIAYLLSGGGLFVREGVMQLSSFPIWLLLVFAFGCGLVVGAFAVIFAIRKTPEVRDLAQLRF
jgi:ABC-type transport system involved in multi-copper enzyme maturation permease subunit